MIYFVLLGPLFFWWVDRNGLSSRLSKKQKKTGLLRERAGIWPCVILVLSHSRNLTQKMLCRLCSAKVLSVFTGFLPLSNGFWEVVPTSQRHHCSRCLICNVWLTWILPDRPAQGNEVGFTQLCSVVFLVVLAHPCMNCPKSVCCALQPCVYTTFASCWVVGKHGARAAAGRPARTKPAPFLPGHPTLQKSQSAKQHPAPQGLLSHFIHHHP